MVFLEYNLGHYEESLDYFETALEYARKLRQVNREGHILINIGDLYLRIGEQESANHAYRKAETLISDSPGDFLRTYARLGNLKIEILSGDLSTGAQPVDSILQSIGIHERATPYETGLFERQFGEIALVKNEISTAIKHLEKAKDKLNDFVLEKSVNTAILATAHHANKEYAKAKQLLSEILTIFENADAYKHVPFLQTNYGSMLSDFQDDQEIGEEVKKLLAELNQIKAGLPRIRQNIRQSNPVLPISAPAIQIKGMGWQPKLFLDHKPVTARDWRNQQNVRELFFSASFEKK